MYDKKFLIRGIEMDIVEVYALFFLALNIINQIKFGCLSTHIIFSVALEIPIIGRVFMLW